MQQAAIREQHRLQLVHQVAQLQQELTELQVRAAAAWPGCQWCLGADPTHIRLCASSAAALCCKPLTSFRASSTSCEHAQDARVTTVSACAVLAVLQAAVPLDLLAFMCRLEQSPTINTGTANKGTVVTELSDEDSAWAEDSSVGWEASSSSLSASDSSSSLSPVPSSAPGGQWVAVGCW